MVGLLSNLKKCVLLCAISLSAALLLSCAASNVSRDAATNVDMGVNNAKNMFGGVGEIGDGYQNSSQATKGAIFGAAAGVAAGTFTSMSLAPATAIGAILGATYGSYIDMNTNYKDKLDNRGANIMVMGDQVMIVLESARIFHALSPTIKTDAWRTLELVADYINRSTKTLVKISAYTNLSNSPTADYALSAQQATAVAKFLAAAGVDARLLYAEGYGGTHLVQPNDNHWFGNDNYRIEITYEKLHV